MRGCYGLIRVLRCYTLLRWHRRDGQSVPVGGLMGLDFEWLVFWWVNPKNLVSISTYNWTMHKTPSMSVVNKTVPRQLNLRATPPLSSLHRRQRHALSMLTPFPLHPSTKRSDGHSNWKLLLPSLPPRG